MIPNFQILDKTFSAYMIVATIGILVMLFTMKHIGKKSGMDELDVQNTLLVSFIGVVLGGHTFSAIGKIYLLIQKHVEIHSFNELISVAKYAFSGSVFYGGLFGAMIASLIFIKIKKFNTGEYMDIAAMAIPLFHFFGRIGCFLSGCCYGIESKIGFIYHYSLAEAANDVRRFPIQLVEAAFNICLFFAIYKLFKDRKFSGKLIYVYLVSYAIARFILEFFRGDEYRGHIGVLSVSQTVSVAILAVVFIIFITKKFSEKNRLNNA